MKLPSYNSVARQARYYLLNKRRRSPLMRRVLPRRLFDAELWLCRRSSVATGVAWGVACALAPLPMQSIFAALCCLWRRGNVPMGVAACWISVPGYQVLAWPLQWWLGASCLNALGLGSGLNMAVIRHMARQSMQSGQLCLPPLGGEALSLLGAEFLLGCLLSCAVAGWLAKSLVLLCWRRR